MQWCIFALGALGGYVVLWRRETRPVHVTAGDLLAAADGPDPLDGTGRRGAAVRPQRPRRRKVDEDFEDALLDAAERPRADADRPAGEPQASDTSSA